MNEKSRFFTMFLTKTLKILRIIQSRILQSWIWRNKISYDNPMLLLKPKPKPETLNPEPWTLNPEPTLWVLNSNPEPWALSPSTVCTQLLHPQTLNFTIKPSALIKLDPGAWNCTVWVVVPDKVALGVRKTKNRVQFALANFSRQSKICSRN